MLFEFNYQIFNRKFNCLTFFSASFSMYVLLKLRRGEDMDRKVGTNLRETGEETTLRSALKQLQRVLILLSMALTNLQLRQLSKGRQVQSY